MMKKVLYKLVFIAVIFTLLPIYDYWQAIYHNPINVTKDSNDEPLVWTIQPGESLNQVIAKLKADDILDDISWLPPAPHIRIYSKLNDIERNLQIGEYPLYSTDTVANVLNRIYTGQAIYQKFTIIEGTTFKTILNDIKKAPELILSDKDLTTLKHQLGIPTESLEGWFAPNTYQFHKNTDAMVILKQSFEAMQRVLLEQWQSRKANLPIESPYQALILASIIEKESGYTAEKQRIAAVFINRLNKKMRLQTDPTVIYGLGTAFNGNLTRKHLKQDTPYNTYTRSGLPPTPIASPSESSIYAVMHPSDDKALYFVSTGEGKHHFSYTYDEHHKAVLKYQLKRK